MEQYPFADEHAVHLEMHLPGFPESQGLVCSEALDHDFSLSAKDVAYAGLSGLEAVPALPPAAVLEADLNTPSLYPAKDCDSVRLLDEPGSRPSQHEPGLPAPTGPQEAGGRGRGGRSAGRAKHPPGSPQTSPPGCSRCGKVFGSASALSKHCLTHSQRREHVCTVCGKAFKRPDHLSGHVLTHRKIKPFACLEGDCDKSYCDLRSLRRHYELRHGLRGAKEAPEEGAREGSPLLPRPSSRGGGEAADRATARSESGPFPPKRDPGGCAASAFATRKLASTDSSPARQPPCLASTRSGLWEAAGASVPKERLSSQKTAAASDVCAVINPGPASVIAPGESVVPNLTGGFFISEAQLSSAPAGPQRYPDSAPPCLPVFRGWKLAANRSSGSFQWTRSAPGCAKPTRNSVSEGLAGPSCAFSVACECPDALSFPVAPFKAEEDASSEPALGCFEEAFQSTNPWETAKELSCPEVPKRGAPQSETGQLFPKGREPAACRGPQHLLGVIAESPQALPRAQGLAPAPPLVAPEAKFLPANPLRAGFRQPPPSPPQLPQPAERRGASTCLPNTIPRFRGVSSDGEKHGPQAAPALQCPVKEYAGLRDIPLPAHLRYGIPGSASGRSNQLENEASAFKGEKGNERGAEAGGKPPAGAGFSWRLPAARRERLTFGLSCAASPSQVAMASFPSAPAASGARRLTIFNRIQGGNIYSLTKAAAEENLLAGWQQSGAAPTDGSDGESGFACKNPGWLFDPGNGPESRECSRGERRRSPQRKAEQQVRDAGEGSAREASPEAVGTGTCPPKPGMPLEDVAVAPLVIPVSVPVTATRAGSEVTEKESPGGKDLKESLLQKKGKRPKSLLIPPPPEAQPGMGGCYRSNLRSPVFLVDHLLRDLFQCSPYTPPPMLSPVREGSGLYFSTLCSSSAKADPNQLLSSVLGRMDKDFGFCLVKDNAKMSVQPHINVGSRFQAEVPNLQDRSLLGKEEQAAALVWKPWGDIATNPATQDRVTALLNMACSSVMPGAGTNLELALHCLHEARGGVLEALEMLLFGAPEKPESHPLANYRYAGSDAWTPQEKQLFNKAFCVHKKDFYLIQKQIQTKNVPQCVEYYYIWKKKMKFACSRAQVMGKKVKDEVEEAEEKAVCSPRKRHRLLPKGSMKIQRRNHGEGGPARRPRQAPSQAGAVGGRGAFPCRECGRVFEKIKGRNAHMKRHRPPEPPARLKGRSQSEGRTEEETPTAPTSPGGSWEASEQQ